MSSIRLKKNIVERKKRSLIRIGILAAVLLVLCMAAYLSVDRTAPTFDFTDAASVYSVEDGAELNISTFLKGVKASDNVDGDLTDRIAIKSMRQNADSSISVIYCVRDNSGNLTVEERIYNLRAAGNDVPVAGNDPVPPDESSSADEPAEQSSEADETGEESQSPGQETQEQPDTSAEAGDDPGTASQESQDVPVTEQSSEPENVPPETVQKSQTPVIRLNAAEAHVAVGSAFDYPSYIAEVWDDVDDQFRLLSNIWIENYELIDWNVSGVYALVFHVIDSDGNISEGQPFTLYMEWQ